MYPSLPCDISVLTGKGNLEINISVQPVYNTLGHRRASSILGFRALTGSDMPGRLQGEPKHGASHCLWPVMMTYVMLLNLSGTGIYNKKNTTSWKDSSANYTSPKYTPKRTSFGGSCTPTAQLRGESIFPLRLAH